MTILVWLRQDLRLTDNPALYNATQDSDDVIPLYILEESLPWSLGQASRWWLHHSLTDLKDRLSQQKISIMLQRGDPVSLVTIIASQYSVTAVYWNQSFLPAVDARDQAIREALEKQGVTVKIFNASLLHSPSDLLNLQGGYYKVFSAFWKKCLLQLPFRTPLPIARIKQRKKVSTDLLNNWNLLPKRPDWAEKFKNYWQVGETAALNKLENFVKHHMMNYAEERDRPDKMATSHLSPHLHFGEISPLQIWFFLQDVKIKSSHSIKSRQKFLSELGWREFSYYLLHHFPDLPDRNYNAIFDNFLWKKDKKYLYAWQRGITGYPIVDAGMRELWQTGYMHNRVRMITASFLTKDLMIDWREGERWFWDTLVDADLANNANGWQWVAGSGSDAAPFFRIFNPVLQGEKFDPQGIYVKQWIPELENLSNKYIHRPWEAPQEILLNARIILGKNYPFPIIMHDVARKRVLSAYKQIKSKFKS